MVILLLESDLANNEGVIALGGLVLERLLGVLEVVGLVTGRVR